MRGRITKPFNPKVLMRNLVREPLVSVIVPTRNSGLTIERCLKSIILQTYPNIEIIVVDNYSTDNTRNVSENLGIRFYTAGPERSVQVNLGIHLAKGEYKYRADSDFILEPTVVEEAVRMCELEGCDMIAVHNTSDPTISFWSRVRKLERDCYRDDDMNIAARFIRTGVFKKLGGFDENLIASEDYELHNRLIEMGYKCGRINAQEVHIGEPKTLRDVISKHIFYGSVIDGFIKKCPDIWMEQLSPFRFAYLRHWRDFLHEPVLMLGFIVYQMVRYCAALIGFLKAKFRRPASVLP